ncbi:MAG: DNA-directed RNA polymerase subunit N [Candidatus Bathyarchaeota archaeon]
MIVPVRCFSCGKVIGDKWEDFNSRVEAGENPAEVLNDLGVTRYCCRRMLLSHVEIIDEVMKFYQAKESPDLRGGKT